MGRGVGRLAACAGIILLAIAEIPLDARAAAGDAPNETIRGGPFSLIDHTGRRVTQDSYPGRFLLLYFGYTHCPDVCPAGLQVIGGALERLGPDARRVQPLFVTLDPERDGVDRLATYLSHFDSRIAGLTGSKEEVFEAAERHGVNVSETRTAIRPGDYAMDHSAYMYLVAPDGTLRMMFRDGIDSGTLAESIARAIARSSDRGPGRDVGDASRGVGDVSPAKAKVLTFTDHLGRPVSEKDFAGEFQLVFFGYTHCPDVCPATLQRVSEALRRLGGAADAIRPVFITLDPERDTPGVLREYVTHFHPRTVGLTGTQAQIEAATRAYDIEYLQVPSPDGAGGVSISHPDDLHLVGPNGRGIAVLEGQLGVDDLVRALAEYVGMQAGEIREAGSGSASGVTSPTEGRIAVHGAWARATTGPTAPAVVYLSIENASSRTDRLVSLSTPLAGLASLHRTVREKGLVRMSALESLEVPAHASISFEPGGLHVMLEDLDSELSPGDRFSLTLHFARQGNVEVDVSVGAPGAMSPPHASDHSHTH